MTWKRIETEVGPVDVAPHATPRDGSIQRRSDEASHHTPNTPGAVPEAGLSLCAGWMHELFRTLDRAVEDADAVAEEGAVHREMDVRFDDRAVDAQLAAPCDTQLTGEIDDVIQQLVQHGGLNHVGPSDERGVIRHGLEGHPAELAQNQTVAHPVLGLRVAPARAMLDDQQAQDDLDGCGGSAIAERAWEAATEIGPDQLEEVIVIEERIEVGQHAVGL